MVALPYISDFQKVLYKYYIKNKDASFIAVLRNERALSLQKLSVQKQEHDYLIEIYVM